MGMALPFLISVAGEDLEWRTIMAGASLLTVLSGLITIAVGDGPHLLPATRPERRMIWRLFRIPAYRASALGYFGHCWEIYSFWVLSPFLVREALRGLGLDSPQWVSLGAFAAIAVGALGCVGGGLLSRRMGSLSVAAVSLAVSGTVCLISPFLPMTNGWFYLAMIMVWGIFVVSDSAQFSAISSQACPPEYVGTALTIQNSIGFAITVVSIEWTFRAWLSIGPYVGWLLAPGPLLGLYFLVTGFRRVRAGTGN